MAEGMVKVDDNGDGDGDAGDGEVTGREVMPGRQSQASPFVSSLACRAESGAGTRCSDKLVALFKQTGRALGGSGWA